MRWILYWFGFHVTTSNANMTSSFCIENILGLSSQSEKTPVVHFSKEKPPIPYPPPPPPQNFFKKPSLFYPSRDNNAPRLIASSYPPAPQYICTSSFPCQTHATATTWVYPNSSLPDTSRCHRNLDGECKMKSMT